MDDVLAMIGGKNFLLSFMKTLFSNDHKVSYRFPSVKSPQTEKMISTKASYRPTAADKIYNAKDDIFLYLLDLRDHRYKPPSVSYDMFSRCSLSFQRKHFNTLTTLSAILTCRTPTFNFEQIAKFQRSDGNGTNDITKSGKSRYIT